MISTSAWNSRSPCPLPALSCFTATSVPLPGSTPLYTYPNPPCPSRFAFENPPVAAPSSSYVNELCDPNPSDMAGDGGGIGPVPCDPLIIISSLSGPCPGEYCECCCHPPPPCPSIGPLLCCHFGMLFA